jgi:DNA-binding NtrC family response regulator
MDESSVIVATEALYGFGADNIIPLAQMERHAIQTALQATNDDVTRAAAMLQINPSTIYRKLQAWEKDANRSV